MKSKICIREYQPEDTQKLANLYYNTVHQINIQDYTEEQVNAWAPASNQEPKDWANLDRSVLADVYYVITDKPNLHHIFPSDFVEKNPGTIQLDSNSLMNIAYLTQITNIQFSNENPIVYIRKYDGRRFEEVMRSHLLPHEVIEWSRLEKMPSNALDIFIEKRCEIFVAALKDKLQSIPFDVFDTREEVP